MDAIYERCCGLDIHKRTVVACMVVPGSGRQTRKEIRTFGTMTDDLLALADWLAARASRMWRWSRLAYFGSHCSICWRTASSCCW